MKEDVPPVPSFLRRLVQRKNVRWLPNVWGCASEKNLRKKRGVSWWNAMKKSHAFNCWCSHGRAILCKRRGGGQAFTGSRMRKVSLSGRFHRSRGCALLRLDTLRQAIRWKCVIISFRPFRPSDRMSSGVRAASSSATYSPDCISHVRNWREKVWKRTPFPYGCNFPIRRPSFFKEEGKQERYQ